MVVDGCGWLSSCGRRFTRSACLAFEACPNDRVIEEGRVVGHCVEEISIVVDELDELSVESRWMEFWLLEERLSGVVHLASPVVGVAVSCELELDGELAPFVRRFVVVGNVLLKLCDDVVDGRGEVR